MQVAGQVDMLVDAQDTAAAVPLMREAAAAVLTGRNKWLAWSSGGPLPCPLAEPLCPADSKACAAWFKQFAHRPTAIDGNSHPPESNSKHTLQPVECEAFVQGGTVQPTAPVHDGDDAVLHDPAGGEHTGEGGLEPLFLARFDAAWILCELATMYVSYLERQKQYREACELLRALLGGAACPSRRHAPPPPRLAPKLCTRQPPACLLLLAHTCASCDRRGTNDHVPGSCHMGKPFAALVTWHGTARSEGQRLTPSGCRGHWWVRLAINTEHIGNAVRALEISESALADLWVRGGARLDLQRRVLRLGKPPRRWRRPPWAAAAAWEPAVVHIEAAPVVSGVGAGTGTGIRNK